MSLIALSLTLFACWEHEIVVEPQPVSEAPSLREGGYEIQILGVSSLACEGVRPQDIVGESIDAELFVRGADVSIDFEGWSLEGTMRDGVLAAEGGSVWAEQGEDDEDVDADTGGGPPRGEEEDPRPPEEEPPAYEELRASLHADIVSERLASGALSIDGPGCAMALEVALLFVGARDDGDEPVVFEDTGFAEETPCDEESDCG